MSVADDGTNRISSAALEAAQWPTARSEGEVRSTPSADGSSGDPSLALAPADDAVDGAVGVGNAGVSTCGKVAPDAPTEAADASDGEGAQSAIVAAATIQVECEAPAVSD